LSVFEHMIDDMSVAVGVEGLAELSAGPALAALLEQLSLDTVSNGAAVEVLRAWSRLRAHVEARFLAVVADVARRDPGARHDDAAWLPQPARYGPDEVRFALSWTRRAGEREHEFADTLVHELPKVHQALSAGLIDRAKAWVFVHHLSGLPEGIVERACDWLLPAAPDWTTSEIRDQLRKLIIELDPARAEDQQRTALGRRRVQHYLDDDGTATLTGRGLPADESAAAHQRIHQVASAAKRAGHRASIDVLRAEVYLRLLDGRFHGWTDQQMITCLLREVTTGNTEAPAGDGGDVATDLEAASVTDADTETTVAPSTGPGAETTADPRAGTVADPGTDPRAGTTADPATDPRAGTTADPRTNPRAETAGVTVPTIGSDENGADRASDTTGSSATGEPTPPVPGVGVRLGLGTLLGRDERPGDIHGLGPVTAPLARRLALRQRTGQWRWIVTDTEGFLLSEGLTRRRPAGDPRARQARGGIVELHVRTDLLAELAAQPPPGWAAMITDIVHGHQAYPERAARLDDQPGRRLPHAALRRHTQLRDRTCGAPGCRHPAQGCAQDHTVDYQHGGVTVRDNLGPLCPHDHALKHDGGWTIVQDRPGYFTWTSPLGAVYRTRPGRIAEPEPPPF
jgi:hypothetical protein